MVAKAKKVKQKSVPQVSLPGTRQALMIMAKERGIKNFRVLNKAELSEVLAEGATPERIREVVSGAVSRWKAGWGSRRAI